MFETCGVSYIYLCYGIHHLFNIVTGKKGTSEAVLIRALEPTIGIEEMKKRRQRKNILTTGPGILTKAMGLTIEDNGCSLIGNKMWLEEGRALELYSAKRIGIDYAGKDALLPWRFVAKNNKWVSQT